MPVAKEWSQFFTGNIMETKTVAAVCPDCGEGLRLGPVPQLGEMFTCPNCWAYLKVTRLEPLELQWDVFEDVDEEWEET